MLNIRLICILFIVIVDNMKYLVYLYSRLTNQLKITTMQNGQILTHTATGVQFEFIRTVKPQFSNFKYVVLLNLKSGKEERFNNSTYLNYFTA